MSPANDHIFGIVPPMVTPFTKDGGIDYDAVLSLIHI